jgi:hypothetical protein
MALGHEAVSDARKLVDLRRARKRHRSGEGGPQVPAGDPVTLIVLPSFWIVLPPTWSNCCLELPGWVTVTIAIERMCSHSEREKAHPWRPDRSHTGDVRMNLRVSYGFVLSAGGRRAETVYEEPPAE